MNSVLADIIDNTSPKLNKKIVDGVNDVILSYSPVYIDKIIKNGMNAMSPGIDLTYNGWRRLSPKEEYEKLYSGRDNRVSYDISRSSLYTVEYSFTYKGEVMNKVIYLAYATKGNIMEISSTPYNLVSILSDTVISPSPSKVFARLLRAKLTFYREDRNFIVDGVKQPGQIVYSDIYTIKGRNITDNLGKVVTPINLYILGHCGVMAAYEKYANIKGVVFTLDDVEMYREKYKIYESTGIKPSKLKDDYYQSHRLKIMIPRDQINKVNNDFVDNFTFGIMYSFDIFPELVLDLINILNKHNISDETMLWRTILGRIVFKNSYVVNKILEDIDDHYITLKSYIDVHIQSKLKETGIYVETFFDLLGVVLANYNMWIMNSKFYSSDISNRYLDILYYINYDLIVGVNSTLFYINRKSAKKELSVLEVKKMISDNLSLRGIYKILSGGLNISLEVANSSSSSDIKYITTSKINEQSNATGVKRSKNTSSLPESMKFIKGQDLFYGSVLFFSKSANSPGFRLNPYVDYNIETGRFIVSEEEKQVIDKLNRLLNSKMGEHEMSADSLIDSDDVSQLKLD